MYSINNMKIGNRILGMVALLLLLMVLSSSYGLWKLTQVGEEINEIGGRDMKLNALIADIEAMQLKLENELEKGIRLGSVKSNGDAARAVESSFAAFQKITKQLDEDFKKAEALAENSMKTAQSEVARREMEAFRKAMSALLKEHEEFDRQSLEVYAMLRKGGGDDIGGAVERISKIGQQLADELDKTHAQIEKFTEDSLRTIAETERAAIIGVLTLTLAAIVLGAAVGLYIAASIRGPLDKALAIAKKVAGGDLTSTIEVKSRDEAGQLMQALKDMNESLARIVGEVRGSAESLSSAAEQVSSTSQSLSQGSSAQAASVEETSASVEQMTASITQNTENARVTDGMANKAAKEAAEGGAAVEQTVEAMKQISKRIGIIDDIAYQTNLLALNAAIEAARAGEHGKGFAVVAGEVRKLAERSQVAAQEIGEMAGNSVAVAEKAGRLLVEMVPSIRKTSDLVQEIAAASEEQSSSVGQVNTAMVQLNQITQQSASSSEELAATAEEMSGQAEQLQQLMAFFRIESSDSRAGNESARRTRLASRLAPAPHLPVQGIAHPILATVHAPAQKEFVKF